MLSVMFSNFNTSNVTIQRTVRRPCRFLHDHFNTSNVTIQRVPQMSLSVKFAYFNTSNVTIQPRVHKVHEG